MQSASSSPAATLLGAWFSACHVSSALIDHHILAFCLTPYFYPVSLLRVIISNWQTKGFGAYLQVEAAWLASSVDSLCGHPPSLCLFHPPFISHSKEPSNSLPFQLKCCCCLSRVNVGMVREAGPSRWIVTFCYCQLVSSPSLDLSPDPSQPLTYHCRIWYEPPLGSLRLGGVGNNPLPSTCFKDLLPLAW